MPGPGELMRRAMYSRRQYAAVSAHATPQTPVRPTNVDDARPVERYHTGHANYSALMRSHDRIHTRHLRG